LDTPYQPPSQLAVPNRATDATARLRRFWLRMIWVGVAGVIIPPMLGLLGTVIGMVLAFGHLRNTGTADPSALANDVSIGLLSTLYSLIISVLALIFLIVAIIRYRSLPKPA
jgi:biopolymer transport protein ExbB